MTQISLVVITRNAEEHIADCLNSVPFAVDKVILDNGSTDKTLEIAQRCGARIFQEEWRGFGPQKRRVTELAKTDWVLSLDADEALSDGAQAELKEMLNGDLSGADAYKFPRLSFHMGQWIHYGGWYPDWQVRLYDRRKANWTSVQLHEKVEAQRVGKMQAPILHWVFRDLADQVRTNNKYSSLGAEELEAKGETFSLFLLLTKPPVKFLETYFFKKGFLDGIPGFVISVGAAYSVFLKWAKLWERERVKSGQ